jgi:hypothetical protein
MPDKIYNPPLPPWLISINVMDRPSRLVIEDIRHHPTPLVIFSAPAARYCGGVAAKNEDGLIIAVNDNDHEIIHIARYIVESMQGKENRNVRDE